MNVGIMVFIIHFVEITLLYGLLFAVSWFVWNEADRKKSWFVAANTNTGRGRVFRARPGHESLKEKLRSGDQLVTKLEASHIFTHTSRGPVFVYDQDTGQVQKKLPAGEGLWEGLDGKTWAAFTKSGVVGMIANSAGNKLEKLLMICAVIGGITLLGVLYMVSKVVGGFGGH